jgi:peroxiredoxin
MWSIIRFTFKSFVITDAQGTILYTEQVGEIADEPNYEAS